MPTISNFSIAILTPESGDPYKEYTIPSEKTPSLASSPTSSKSNVSWIRASLNSHFLLRLANIGYQDDSLKLTVLISVNGEFVIAKLLHSFIGDFKVVSNDAFVFSNNLPTPSVLTKKKRNGNGSGKRGRKRSLASNSSSSSSASPGNEVTPNGNIQIQVWQSVLCDNEATGSGVVTTTRMEPFMSNGTNTTSGVTYKTIKIGKEPVCEFTIYYTFAEMPAFASALSPVTVFIPVLYPNALMPTPPTIKTHFPPPSTPTNQPDLSSEEVAAQVLSNLHRGSLTASTTTGSSSYSSSETDDEYVDVDGVSSTEEEETEPRVTRGRRLSCEEKEMVEAFMILKKKPKMDGC